MENVWGIISSKVCDNNKQHLSAKELEVTIANQLYNIVESAFKSLDHIYDKKRVVGVIRKNGESISCYLTY